MNTARPPVLPNMLSSTQRKALALIASRRLHRMVGGWGVKPYRVSLDVVNSLIGLSLVRIDRFSDRHPFPVLTGAGRDLLDVIEARRRRA